MTSRFTYAALLASLALPAAAFAQTPAAASPLTANVSLASNYKFRGQDQNYASTKALKPALQGGFDYAFDNGFYIGNWNSTVNWTKYLASGNNSAIEVDLYGGYKFKAGPLDMDVGALAYLYPGAGKANTTELYVGATYGPVTAKYATTVSSGYFGIGTETIAGVGSGDGRGTSYLSLAVAQEVMPKLTLKASVGLTSYKSRVKAAGIPNYTDVAVGASYDLGNGLSLSGTLVAASNKNNYLFPAAVDPSASKSINKNTLVVMLTKAL